MRKVYLILLAVFVGVIRAQPYEAYPASKQYPPIAQPGEEYWFQLSNDTYKSSSSGSSQIVYEAFSLPSWLSFDSSERVLSGTPSEEDMSSASDVNYFSFVLQGTDASDGQSLNKTYQLALSNKTAPEVSSSFNLLSLLKLSGYTNGKNGLKLSPGEVFNVTFDRDTFTNEDSIVAFYGLSSRYHAPLPSWLFFDSSSLKFSGTAPVVNSNIAPELDYNFSLIATDIEGYTAAEVVFELVIGAHQFTTSIQNTLIVNVSDSGSFSYDIPLNYIFLDDDPVSTSNISSVELLDAPSWVNIDNYTLSGTMPSTNSTGNFSVAIYDIFDDVIYLNFAVESTQKLFAVTSLPGANATRGEWFQYALLPSQFTDYDGTTVSVDFSNSSASSWLHFQSSNLTLSGKVPDDFDSLDVGVTAEQGSRSQELSFKIRGIDSTVHTSSSSSHSSSSTKTTSSATGTHTSATASSTTSSSATTTAPAAVVGKSKKNNHAVAIACGVAIPVGIILLLLLIFLLWRRKRNQGDQDDNEKSPKISNPKLGNPSNNPNGLGAVSPFGDENSLDDSSTAKRLGALNAMKLDEGHSSGSEGSTFEEKLDSMTTNSSSSDMYHDALQAGSREALLPGLPNDEYFDTNNRTSSVYFNSEPTNRKSWRFSTAGAQDSENVRESYNSLNTVSTAELLNTQIAENKTLPKDPRKSSFGLRDSVFWKSTDSGVASPRNTKPFSPGGPRYTTNNLSVGSTPAKRMGHRPDQNSFNSQTSTSSSDDFIPVKQGDKYEWVERNASGVLTPTRKRSIKKLVNLPNKSGVGVCDANDIQGHEPEME